MNESKTCFRKVDYDLNNLLSYVETGDIGLPDIQRPFVWTNAKIRDLLDSMYKGFPVGYLLFWENTGQGATRQIGLEKKAHNEPRKLIIDGQQRLTSLYAVFKGVPVLDEDFNQRKIEIAFKPSEARFEVCDAAIRRNPEWIPNVTDLWLSAKSSYKVVGQFLERLSKKEELSEELKERISQNIERLFELQKYPFTALEISANVDEEQVADIFVRINSEGVKLTQADFILTLLSVFWEPGRRALEDFCRAARNPPGKDSGATPYNHLIEPYPDQLLRVSIALAFMRARMKSVYQILRGKDIDTGTYSNQLREQNFAKLQNAQEQVLNLTNWHHFCSAIIGAGFRSAEQISSGNSVIFAYAFYLIGRVKFKIAESDLQRLIARWFFSISLTSRYVGNAPETQMDADLNRIKAVNDAQQLVEALDHLIQMSLTNDFWDIALPAKLESSSARNPELFAFIAALNRLGAPVLFSKKKVIEMLDPAIKTKKKSLERHHLFPRAYLERQGVTDMKKINQIANYALVEWPDNIKISDQSPAEYVPALKSAFSEEEWLEMHKVHALPIGWERMEYDAFLFERRQLMAKVIRRGFETLS
ncbi:MAG: DUF262 domain-containing protein [Turneriella sp.]